MTNDQEPGRKATRLANAVLIVGAAVCLFELYFAFSMHRALAWRVAFPALTLLLLGALRIKPAYRLSLALTVLPSFPGACGVMYAFENRMPPDGTAVVRRGKPFDTRNRWEVIDDLRREGKDAFPSIGVHQFLAGDNLGPHIARPQAMLPVIDGVRIVPLAGISGVTTALCNEGGEFATYASDEHGFRNPKGIWALPQLEIAAVGDSFAGGDCVALGSSAVSHIRERYPATLNLGVSGNGPLAELAGLQEFVAERKPRVVLWFYYGNDLGDLDLERQSPILQRYLEVPFRYDLEKKQPQIDQALRRVLVEIDRRAVRWPTSLAKVGLTRRGAPMWLSDLVMGEQHSIAGQVMRLDALDASRAPPAGAGRPFGEFALFKEILTKAKGLVSSWGGTLYFVYVPDLHFLARSNGREMGPNREPVLAAVREVGLPLIDVVPAVLAAPDLSALMPHQRAHFGEAGYRLMADVVLAALEGH
jgi:hypothetical protein